MNKQVSALALLIAITPSTLLADMVVDKMTVVGNKRLENATIISYLPFEKGDKITDEEKDEALKKLYATGLFDDVKIDSKKNDLIITVKERPVVSQITFEGNDKIDEKTLLQEVQVKLRDVYSPVQIKKDAQRLQKIYQRMGLYSAKVKYEVEDMSRNRVNVIFKIEEGKKNYIEDITFTGNDAFSSADLREVMLSKEKRWYRFLTSTDTYDPDRLNYDKELLRRFYLSKGYVDFEIKDADVSQDKEKDTFSIHFTVSEGRRFKYGDITLSTTLPDVDKEKLIKSLTMKKGRYYNGNQIEDAIETLTDELGREGYAFVNITPQFEKNEENNTVNIRFKINEGERVFVNQINITGNTRTLDKVIRRELRLSETDPFNTEKVRRSRQRIENLGYFDKVDVKTHPIVNASDKTDIDIEVSEKSTGAFNIGIGWSTYDGMLFEVGVQERNLLGTGNILGVTASTSGRENQIDLSFTNPYFMDKPISAGIDIYHTKRDYTDDSSYEWATVGGAIRFGWDYTDYIGQSVKYTLQQDDVTDVESDASIYIKEQQGENILSMIGQVLSYDSRDNRFDTSEGLYTSLGLDFAGIGGDNKFVRINLNATQYISLTEKIVLSIGGTAGYVVGFGGDDVRINNRYFLGGSSLRGFEVGGVGARDKVSDDSLGGDWRLTASAQLMFPVGLPTEFGVKGKLFIDAGMIGKPSGSYDWNDIHYSNKPRVSIGTGILWRSPMGPINIDLGYPIVKEDYDKKEVFRLNFGTGF